MATMTTLSLRVPLCVALAALAFAPVVFASSAAPMRLAAVTQAPPSETPSLTDVTGVWIMLVEGHQVGLELEQEDTVVKGVMLMMGQRQLLEGTYVDRQLTLRPEVSEDAPPAGHGTAHAGLIVARMLDDGTLEGEMPTRRGRRTWTGERLKPASATPGEPAYCSQSLTP